MSRTVRRANNAKSEIRAGVEHVFAEQIPAQVATQVKSDSHPSA